MLEADRVQLVKTESKWLFGQPASDARIRLIGFPFAGGSVAAFQGWSEGLGPQIGLQIVSLPGRGSRLFDPPCDDWPTLVDVLCAELAPLFDRPVAFFGHSLGALLAFETARALRSRGLPLHSLWLSGAEAPHRRALKRRLHDLPERDLIEALRDYNGTPAELLDHAEMMELLLPGIRADFALSERYVWQDQEGGLTCPMHLLLGDADPYVELPRALAWSELGAAGMTRHDFNGDHFFLNPHQQAIWQRLQDGLRV